MNNNCIVCDRPVVKATSRLNNHPLGCVCARCTNVCFGVKTPACKARKQSWRERALIAEARVKELEFELENNHYNYQSAWDIWGTKEYGGPGRD